MPDLMRATKRNQQGEIIEETVTPWVDDEGHLQEKARLETQGYVVEIIRRRR